MFPFEKIKSCRILLSPLPYPFENPITACHNSYKCGHMIVEKGHGPKLFVGFVA